LIPINLALQPGEVVLGRETDCVVPRVRNRNVWEGLPMGSVVKKRRKKIRKHKHKKLLDKTRHKKKRR